MHSQYKQKLNKHKLALVISSMFALSGCASLMEPDSPIQSNEMNLKKSYLESEGGQPKTNDQVNGQEFNEAGEFVRLNNLSDNKNNLKLEIDLSKQFSDNAEFQVSVNELPLNDFLHYVLGDLLNVSYLIEPSVKNNTTPVTLELKEKVSGKKLFQLVQQILAQNTINVAINDDVFFIHPLNKQGSRSDTAFGYGSSKKDVPNVSGDILQLVPAKYGVSVGLRNTLTSLVDATVTIDPTQGLVTIKGKRPQVVRAIELLKLLESKAMLNKAIAMLSFQYIDSETFIEKVTSLLQEEGVISKSTRAPVTNLQFIPIEHLGKVVVFASADEILDRVEYWADILDKPRKGSEQSFYTYHPRYARASDLGESLTPLISSTTNKSFSRNTTTNLSNSASGNTQQNNRSSSTNATQSTQAIEGENMRMVVDSRSNSLIFYSTGKHYQELQPIIRKLDVMPKQVMLEVVIAEVTLTGSFAKGVEYAIKSGPSGSTTESFNYNGESGFSYSVVGLDGSININLNQKDGLVNVLSRPTLLVRDGVDATISVGDDVPTVGSTTADPINGDRETTNIQYRKTGIDLTVTPTVNAQGTVIMTISQNISNIAADGLSISGSPSIFERKVSTEVVAGDGQTVMLGGLISENRSNNANAIPGLGDLPLLGHLFRSDSETTSKTELVILVTPKIVHNLDDWKRVQDSFIQGLENINL
ncbi:secretin N-terminal domain-containing protein [Thalassotalea atypica]|uniref:secretin N-terminal domain-containing protein n=1 Tax=Thalassotalea atypica TaxID=2054316 RepID=UPI0025730208|nr:secretin N-terminal domain-containing protein [Thalassotalea atypica]